MKITESDKNTLGVPKTGNLNKSIFLKEVLSP